MLMPRFIDKGANPRPDGRTPTGAADLLMLAMENNKGARIGIRGCSYVRHEPLLPRQDTGAFLPGRPGEIDAFSTATSGPARFGSHRAGGRQMNGCAAYRDDMGAGRHPLCLEGARGRM